MSSAEETAKDVYRVLAQQELMSPPGSTPSHRFLATGDPAPFRELGRRFLGPEVSEVEHAASVMA